MRPLVAELAGETLPDGRQIYSVVNGADLDASVRARYEEGSIACRGLLWKISRWSGY